MIINLKENIPIKNFLSGVIFSGKLHHFFKDILHRLPAFATIKTAHVSSNHGFPPSMVQNYSEDSVQDIDENYTELSFTTINQQFFTKLFRFFAEQIAPQEHNLDDPLDQAEQPVKKPEIPAGESGKKHRRVACQARTSTPRRQASNDDLAEKKCDDLAAKVTLNL